MKKIDDMKINNMNRLAPGDIAEFTKPKNGRAEHQEEAAEHLTVGESYTVTRVEVGGWHTDIWLEGVAGVRFNSVLFDFWMKEVLANCMG